ncbi:MAG: glycine--tRNA ligase [Candidatus Omnitrophica bacterium CG11_big_fil_rev_8_21_14_0_20_41_12]|nr:MAG: glycine--tRNA ligase [Candidatus Omnitrophica bacterium CG11_big_fil_rev_8_21_14_0_20_41_12]
MAENLMDKITSLCKRRGFIFQGSEIYGGLANTWDYGPHGVELKNNLKRAWWKACVYERNDIFGMDAAILMHPKVWESSGHVENFFDLKSDCKACKKRFKTADLKNKLKCPECSGELTESRPFNLMFKTHQGPVEDASNQIHLRPETAQGMFVNFLNILDSKHPKLPFGLAQIGKSFRNEITPGNFTFRTREFEQMEIEYFCRPEEADKIYELWVEERFNWYLNLGIKKENLRRRPHEKDELAHYALACTDIEYNFPFGWSELEGIANRTDFDLKQHSKFSGKELQYFDDQKKERFYPYIIEPSGGVDRSVLAILVDAYHEEKVKEDTRVVLKLNKDLAPTKVAVLPLLRNRPEIVELAKNIAKDLKKSLVTVYDDTGAIGKLYRRQDEVGTLFCVTVDVQSLEDKQVTVRFRDTMQQERISLDKLKEYLINQLV